MSGSIFNTGEEEDPWSSTAGWNDTDTKPIVKSPIPSLSPTPYQSTYLTSSELLNQTRAGDNGPSGASGNSRPSISMSNVPASYESIRSHLVNKITTINDFEFYILDKLIELQYLTNYQKTKLLDIVYDNDLIPVTLAQNFYQILGLIALEIDVPGSGDFVTLQFKLNNLPELPQQFVKLIKREDANDEAINDPLRANTSRANDVNIEDVDATTADWNQRGKIDPVLTDHSDSQHQLLGDNSNKDDGDDDGDGVSPQDASYIEKYIEDVRDEFKPLVLDDTPVKIKELPEKEGLLFKHINYIITHNLVLGQGSGGGLSGQKKVIRRYSDFAWYV